MARRASVPIEHIHVSEAIKALGGGASQRQIANYICLKYFDLLRPKDPRLAHSTVQLVRTRVSSILSQGKANGLFERIDEWRNLRS